jgi:O-succinylbenzoate synthase
VNAPADRAAVDPDAADARPAARALAERVVIPGIDAVVPFRVALTTRFRGVTERDGLLVHGPHGWGEWSPFDEYDDEVAAVWLASAVDAACVAPPPARRDRIPVNVTVPVVGPDAARRIIAASGCTTAKVKVAESGQSLSDDVARVAAVRAALGPGGRIRVDANAAWSVAEAVEALGRIEEAAGGLEYAEQPCATLEGLAEVRERTGVRIAADEAIRRDHADPSLLRDAVDVAVIKVQASGGVAAALALIERLGLPAVVSSALETSVGLATGVRLAAALPSLGHACGLATGLLLAEDVVNRPLLPEDGMLGVGSLARASAPRDPVPSPPADRVAWLVDRAGRARLAMRRAAEERPS